MVTSRMNGTGTYMETEDRPGAAHTQWLGAKALGVTIPTAILLRAEEFE